MWLGATILGSAIYWPCNLEIPTFGSEKFSWIIFSIILFWFSYWTDDETPRMVSFFIFCLPFYISLLLFWSELVNSTFLYFYGMLYFFVIYIFYFLRPLHFILWMIGAVGGFEQERNVTRSKFTRLFWWLSRGFPGWGQPSARQNTLGGYNND